jgi:isopenicillin-N N-acyltransferase-like protein
MLGQNQDLEPEYGDVAILLRVMPDDGRPSALMFTFAGQLGYSGMNDRGVAHFANAMYGIPWRPGSPHYPVKRAMLEQTSIDEVLKLLERTSFCSAANMVVADGLGNIADFEILPDAVTAFIDDHPDKLIHANHCQSPEFEGRDRPLLKDSYDRLARMRKLVADSWGSITVDTMKAILADHQGDPGGICRHGAANMHSVSGYIAQPEERTLHVRRGHGCDGTWTAYQV